jgi:hypothetical protein
MKRKKPVPARFIRHEQGKPSRITDVTGRAIEPGDINDALQSMSPEQADKILAENVKGYAVPKSNITDRITIKHSSKEEDWFQACESVGLTWLLKAYFIVVGAGAGVATIIWMANQ